MTRILLLAMTLLCCPMWVIAQNSQDQPSGNSGASSRPPEMNPSSRQMTIEGCLANSGDKYMITDSAGTKYQLIGNTSSLNSHVNQLVKLTGTGQGTGTQGTGTATTTEATETFHVAKVSKIADSCSKKSK